MKNKTRVLVVGMNPIWEATSSSWDQIDAYNPADFDWVIADVSSLIKFAESAGQDTFLRLRRDLKTFGNRLVPLLASGGWSCSHVS